MEDALEEADEDNNNNNNNEGADAAAADAHQRQLPHVGRLRDVVQWVREEIPNSFHLQARAPHPQHPHHYQINRAEEEKEVASSSPLPTSASASAAVKPAERAASADAAKPSRLRPARVVHHQAPLREMQGHVSGAN
jgi:hypothetical protein